MTKKEFIYNGRSYEKSINRIIHFVEKEVAYPSTPYNMGIKEMLGERGLFNILIKDAFSHSKIPKVLIDNYK